mgnify:FL=1
MAKDFTLEKPLELFNAYVTNISASASYGADGSSCQMTLVGGVDPTTGKSLDGFDKDWEPDFPELGTAVGIKWGEFTFGGIFQRYTHKKSTGGYTWDIVIESPAKVLDGIQVILEGFQGTSFTGASNADPLRPFNPQREPVFTNQMNNIWNPFAIRENYQFGGGGREGVNPYTGGVFGGSNVNSAGFPALDALRIVQQISTGAGDPSEAIWPLPVESWAHGEFGGKATFGESEYLVDLNSIIDIPDYPQYFRVKGPVQSLNALIQETVDVVVHDYIVSVAPCSASKSEIAAEFPRDVQQSWRDWYDELIEKTKAEYGGEESSIAGATRIGYQIDTSGEDSFYTSSFVPLIKINVEDKSLPPEEGVIAKFVKDQEMGHYGEKKLIGADTGKEYNDAVTQKLVIGGKASRYYKSHYPIPIWGKTKYGKAQYNLGPSPDYSPGGKAGILLNDDASYDATILEIRAAMSGRETWEAYHIIKSRLEGGADQGNFCSLALTEVTWARLQQGKGLPVDFMDTSARTSGKLASTYLNQNITQQLDQIFNAVKGAADQFYGQKFMIPLPVEPGGIDNNLKWITEDMEYINSWDIASSAWIDGVEVINKNPGGGPQPFRDISFYDSDGRPKQCAVYPKDILGTHDFSSLGDSYTAGFGGIATTKASIEDDIMWIDWNGVLTALVPAECPKVLNYDEFTTPVNGIASLAYLIGGVSLNPRVYGMFGFENLQFPLGPAAVIPAMFGVPQESNRYCWGPWYQYSKLDGRAEVEFIDSLKPETFGNWVDTNNAGWAYSQVGNAMLGGQESGYVELAEIPQYNLTQRFFETGPYVTSMDINIGTGGVTTNYKFNTWTRQFGKLAKYNVDRLSRINKNTIKFLQEQRGKFNKRPLPQKQMLQPAQNKGPNFKTWLLQQSPAVQAQFGFFGLNKAKPGNPPQQNPLGPHHYDMSGNRLPENDPEVDPTRAGVGSSSVNSLLGPMSQDYKGSAVCGHEALWTPIAINRDLEETPSPGFEAPAQPEQTSEGPFGKGADHVGPTAYELDPYFFFGSPRDQGYGILGHNDSTEDLNIQKTEGDITKVRTIALKGPLVLSGPGFDLGDLPTPEGDSQWKYDESTKEGNRAKWKAGPVSLMWDDERKVWAGGHQLIQGIAIEDITAPDSPSDPTYFWVEIYRKGWEKLPDTTEKVKCVNRDPSLEQKNVEGKVYVVASRINYEWVPIWVGCPQEDEDSSSSSGGGSTYGSSLSQSDGTTFF